MSTTLYFAARFGARPLSSATPSSPFLGITKNVEDAPFSISTYRLILAQTSLLQPKYTKGNESVAAAFKTSCLKDLRPRKKSNKELIVARYRNPNIV